MTNFGGGGGHADMATHSRGTLNGSNARENELGSYHQRSFRVGEHRCLGRISSSTAAHVLILLNCLELALLLRLSHPCHTGTRPSHERAPLAPAPHRASC